MNFHSVFAMALRFCIQVAELIMVLLYLPFVVLFWSYESEGKLNQDGRIKPAGRLFALRAVVEYILWNYDRPNYEAFAEYAKNYDGANLIGKVPLNKAAMLHISDLQLAKQIMGSSTWANRLPEGHYLHVIAGGKPLGLLLGCEESWQQPRRLTLKLLHNLDFFKTSRMEDTITFEINELKADLLARVMEAGGSLTFSPQHMFELASMNIVCQVVMGKRFDADDTVMKEIMKAVSAANRQVTIGYNPLELVPWLKYLHYFIPSLRSLRKGSALLDNFCRGIIQERRARGTYKLQPDDFVDYFLQEIDKEGGKKNTHITDEALMAVLRDLMLGGMETSAGALEYGLLHVSLQPEIQRRVQEEIDEVIGSRSPAYEDRNRMPYTQAVLHEILRVGSVFPITARSPVRDTKLEAYSIPKRSLCGINIYSIHRDPKLWDEPEEFRPERFLTSKDNSKLVNTDKIIPFGHGRRNCVGETLARCTLFIFFVTMIQSFTFSLSDSHPAPSMGNVHGVTRCPMPYFLVAKMRLPRQTASARS